MLLIKGKCEICNCYAVLENKNATDTLGDECSCCHRWICHGCIDFKFMLTTDYKEPICVECVKEIDE